MKLFSLSGLLVAGAFVSACAVNPPPVYGPGPAATGTASTTVVRDGMIAECGHPGAPSADVVYPEGWQTRLSEVAQKSASSGELLGGPVTTEVVDRDAQPIERPVPAYPAAAGSAGREAMCYAMMDVNTSGAPEEILTACSSPEFNSATFNAMQSARFSPKVVDGRNVRRLNVVYPVQYCVDG
ncbi:MAG: energy transducer TonB [Henriciella sp.]|uniref:energy transducer TonB n=1 Tax=Henriciella sp. TaxID=1968823 RepID=UPI003C77AE21